MKHSITYYTHSARLFRFFFTLEFALVWDFIALFNKLPETLLSVQLQKSISFILMCMIRTPIFQHDSLRNEPDSSSATLFLCFVFEHLLT